MGVCILYGADRAIVRLRERFSACFAATNDEVSTHADIDGSTIWPALAKYLTRV